MKNLITSFLLVSYLAGQGQTAGLTGNHQGNAVPAGEQLELPELLPDLFKYSDNNAANTSINSEIEYGKKHGIGLCGGWGAPYGFGAEYSYLFSANLDINVGAGFSFSGLRTGLGIRYYFKKEGSSPYVGFNYVHTSGLSNLEITIDSEMGTYKIYPDEAVFFRGGYKVEVGDVLFMFNAGYGLPFDGKDAEFQGGNYSSRQQDFANLQALGGIEISLGVIFRVGKP